MILTGVCGYVAIGSFTYFVFYKQASQSGKYMDFLKENHQTFIIYISGKRQTKKELQHVMRNWQNGEMNETLSRKL